MPYNWKDITQNQLAQNGAPMQQQSNMLAPLQNMTQQNNNNAMTPYQRYQKGMPQLPANEEYPNAQFPRLRQWWEANKEMYGNVLKPIGNAAKEVGKGTKGFFVGTPDMVEQYSKLTPQQQSIMQLLQNLGIYDLQNPYEGFEGIANEAHNDFQQNTVPGLAHQFTSLGNASLTSPAFTTSLARAGAGLHQNLANQKAQYGQQNKQQTIQMLLSLLNPGVENIHRPQSNGVIQQGINAVISAATKAATGG